MATKVQKEAAEMVEARDPLVRFLKAAAHDIKFLEQKRKGEQGGVGRLSAHQAQILAARKAKIKKVQMKMKAKKIGRAHV